MLKIDLLPAHYAVARRNKKTIFLSIPLLVGVALLWLLVMVQTNKNITTATADLDKATTDAKAVLKVQDDTKARQAELDPIQAKVKFVQDADVSGLPFWDRFHKINQYVYDRALVRNFTITPPGSVSFSAELTSTEDAGRFILNLIRCPYITGISISGSPGVSGAIEGAGGASAPAAASPGGAGGPGMPGMAGGPGMPGGPPGGPGMPGGAPGGPGGAAPAAAGAAQGPIVLSVTATLVEPIAIPAPPSPAPPAGAGGMEGPGGPGGPGGPAGPAGPGGPSGPGASGAKAKSGGSSEDSSDDSGSKKKKSGDDSGGGSKLKSKGGGDAEA